jgi:hypothetical protein
MKGIQNMKAIRNSAISIGLALIVLVALFTLIGASPSGGGVVGHKYQVMTFASTSYTSSQTASAAGVDVGLFGSVEIQTLATVTGTGTVTVTPQFSNQPVVCSAVTSWVSAFDEQIIPASSRTATVASTSGGTITTTGFVTTTGAITVTNNITNATTSTTVDTSGTLARQTLSLITSGSVVTGANTIELRELTTQGRCFRVQITSNMPVFTPTVYLRMVNRQ